MIHGSGIKYSVLASWYSLMLVASRRKAVRPTADAIYLPRPSESKIKARCRLVESGFPKMARCDSSFLLELEAGMDGATSFGRSAEASAGAL